MKQSLGVNLAFDSIAYFIEDKDKKKKRDGPEMKNVLSNVSGFLPAGQLLGVMGASGAGKTTLLDVLAQRNMRGQMYGRILIDGKPPTAHFHRISGYVMQDDALISTLTVRETLKYSLELRVPRHSLNTTEREERIDAIIKVLNLKKVENRLVGNTLKRGISGGERRRLSIGVEMVTYPKILFLDEPTSGLDAQNALRVMKAIRKVCAGRTVVCTIHQPRSNVFFMMDQLLLLHNGLTVYYGSTKDSLTYFQNLGYPCPRYMNPADHFLDVLEGKQSEEDADDDSENDSGAAKQDKVSVDGNEGNDDDEKRAQMFVERFKNSKENKALTQQLLVAPPQRFNLQISESDETLPPPENSILSAPLLQQDDISSTTTTAILSDATQSSRELSTSDWSDYPTSFCQQYLTLTHRLLIATKRDTGIIYVRTGAALGIGLLVGLIFFNQKDTEDSSGSRINVMLFVMCVFSLFCLPAISKFIEDRLLFTREKAAGCYRTSAYFLATWSVEFPLLLIVVLLYGVICYWLVGLQPTIQHFFFFIFIILLVINVGFAISQAISAAVSSVMAIACYMIILVYSLLLGGFIVSRNDMPDGMVWALKTSYFNYGFQALCVNEFEDKDYGADTLSDLGMLGANKYDDMGVLVGMFFGLRFIAYLFLRYFQREQR